MNKLDLLHKIKDLQGLSNDEKALLINLVNTNKKYGLVWEDKPEDVEEELLTKLPVLIEDKEKFIEAKPQPKKKDLFNKEKTENQKTPNHILIEGDNLHALTALTFTHENRIDVIYIDPPYNTGENDFKYNDKYVDKEDGFRHSKWLSFIYKRLKLAKRLLSETGVAIIHIDENEFDVLSLLLETEIFSENDCIGYIVWNKKNPKGDAKGVANMHEYVFCFAKSKIEFLQLENTLTRRKPNALEILKKSKLLFNKLGRKTIPDEIKEVVKPFNYSNEILKDFEVIYDLELINKEFQSWIERQNEFSEGEKAYKFIDENGDVFQTVSMAWPNKEQAPDDYFIPLMHPINNNPCPVPERGWRNPTATMKSLLGNKHSIELPGGMVVKGEVTFTINKNGENNQPRRKYLLKENMLENTPSIFNYGASDDDLFTSLGLNFPYAKPVAVAKYLIESIHPNPKIICDFFAGSGTALHAVMELNNEDNKRRQCIIITNNEVDSKTEKKLEKEGIYKGTIEYYKNGICNKITYPRLEKIINGFIKPNGDKVEGLTNNNFRYFKTAFVGREKTTKNKKELTQFATEMLCIKENIYEEVKQLGDYKLYKQFVRCFSDNSRYLLIIYDEDVIEQMVEVIDSIDTKEKIKIYVFAPGQYPYTEDFEEVLHKVELCALPDAIYKTYMNILPRKSKKMMPEIEEEVMVAENGENTINLFNQQ